MKTLFYIIAAIFLFFTAPIWVPAVGILGLATGIGALTAIIAANHESPAAPAPIARPAALASHLYRGRACRDEPSPRSPAPAPGGRTGRLRVGLRSPGLPHGLRMG